MDIKESIEQFNLFKYLQDAGVAFDTSIDGTEYVAECFNCYKNKLYIAAVGDKKGVWHCFRCGQSGNIFSLVSAIESIPYKQAFVKIVQKKTFIRMQDELPMPEITDDKVSLKRPPEVDMPFNFVSLLAVKEGHQALAYVKKRGLSAKDMEDFCLMYSPSDQRLVFPVFLGGYLIGWQGRDISGRSDRDPKYPKALTGPSKRTGKGFRKSSTFYNLDRVKEAKFVTIVEGPIDCIKGRLVNSIALFGKSMSSDQFKLLLSLRKLKTVFIGLDPEAENERIELAKRLSPFFDVRMVPIPESLDFGACSPKQILGYVKNSTKFKNAFLIGL